MYFSIIVPVYNRRDEIDELLSSLCLQTYRNFEVLIVEDGSGKDCREVVDQYRNRLNLKYYFKENSGQGFSRNYGFERADGDYFVVFDSDCTLPAHYFQTVVDHLNREPGVDAWGGPDRAHTDFTQLQRAINYAMTSPLTTGGIRGRKGHLGEFHPRSFNMGISREVYLQTGGYKITRMGEDLEFSIRIIKQGYRVKLIEDAFVYHKRRSSLREFYRQLHFFGRARVNVTRYHPETLKPFHLLPSLMLLLLPVLFLLTSVNSGRFALLSVPVPVYILLLFMHSLSQEKNLKIALLSIVTSILQLTAYGAGLLQELFSKSHRPVKP